ncbi:MAG: asparagine synthase (glutamine-hydrolyzing) [Candidatus Falkowbacteria bacterium]
MCGIAGFFGQGDKNDLERMTRTMNYRGPNDEGFFMGDNVGLGQRRLSIIDLSPGGHQPLANEDESLWIILNGEIYNYLELKKSLSDSHRFRGNSDTEIILHLYEEVGLKVFEKLNGMFALAIYDSRESRVILARDRLGKKPLYWGIFDNTLIFGSEPKALLGHSACKKELDLESLNKYLQFGYIPTPYSIYKNIRKLEPASYLVYSGKNVEKNIFWEISFGAEGTERVKHDEQDVIAELDNRLDSAVRDRLMSDVPLGIFLSGGIDSSTIAYYAQKNSDQKIKTFSIGFKEASFDESQYARRAAEHLGTDHYEKILGADDCLGLILRIAGLLDEPMADPSIIPTFLLSEFTRERVTVALGGDGGDELFCGYDTFVAHRFAEIYSRIPLVFRKALIEPLVKSLPTSFSNLSLDFKAKSFIKGFYGEAKYRDARWMGAFNRAERSLLLNPDILAGLETVNEFADIDHYLVGKEDDYYNSLIKLYLRMYMMDQVLVKVDRASMYNGLEVRAPFLDYQLVDYVNSLPLNLKLRGFKTKYILKKLMEDKLPRAIVYRKKKGFGLPVAAWISGPLKSLVLNLFSEEKIKNQGLFNYKYVNKILNNHFSRKCDNRLKIWNLMVFQLWYEKWL